MVFNNGYYKLTFVVILITVLITACYSEVFEEDITDPEGEIGDDLTPPSNGGGAYPPETLSAIYSGLFALTLEEKSVEVITPATTMGLEDDQALQFAAELRNSIANDNNLLSRIMAASIEENSFDPQYPGNLLLFPVFGNDTGEETPEDLEFAESSISRESLVAFYEQETETEISDKPCTVNTTNSLALNTAYTLVRGRSVFPQATTTYPDSTTDTYPEDTTDQSQLQYYVAEVVWSMQQRFSGIFSECNRITEISYHAVWSAERLEDAVCAIDADDYPDIDLSTVAEACEQYPDPVTE